jgi:hypothetical protein
MATKLYHVEKTELPTRKVLKFCGKAEGIKVDVNPAGRYVGMSDITLTGDGRKLKRFAKEMWGWS